MLNLMRVVDRATGYIFVPPPNDPKSNPAPPGTVNTNQKDASKRPNTYALFSSAMGPLGDSQSGKDVRDVQERWVDAREAYDAFENREWRKEGEAVRQAHTNVGKPA